MISGDRRSVAERVGRELGVDRAYAEQSPEDKLEVVRSIRADPGLRPVVMVGDGVNDAPALAIADLGIAMGAAGAAVSVRNRRRGHHGRPGRPRRRRSTHRASRAPHSPPKRPRRDVPRAARSGPGRHGARPPGTPSPAAKISIEVLAAIDQREELGATSIHSSRWRCSSRAMCSPWPRNSAVSWPPIETEAVTDRLGETPVVSPKEEARRAGRAAATAARTVTRPNAGAGGMFPCRPRRGALCDGGATV